MTCFSQGAALARSGATAQCRPSRTCRTSRRATHTHAWPYRRLRAHTSAVWQVVKTSEDYKREVEESTAPTVVDVYDKCWGPCDVRADFGTGQDLWRL